MKVLPNGLALSELSTAWQYIYFSIFTKGSSHLWVLRHLSANLTASLCVRRESYYSAQVPIITVIATHGDSNFLNGLSEQENLDVVMPRESPEEDTWPQRPAPQRWPFLHFLITENCHVIRHRRFWFDFLYSEGNILLSSQFHLNTASAITVLRF